MHGGGGCSRREGKQAGGEGEAFMPHALPRKLRLWSHIFHGIRIIHMHLDVLATRTLLLIAFEELAALQAPSPKERTPSQIAAPHQWIPFSQQTAHPAQSCCCPLLAAPEYRALLLPSTSFSTPTPRNASRCPSRPSSSPSSHRRQSTVAAWAL